MNITFLFLFFSLFCLTTKAEIPHKKSGFYAGVMGGVTSLNTKYDLTYYQNPITRAHYDGGKTFITGGGIAGYHFSLNPFYVETELYGLYQNTTLWIPKDGGWNALSVSVKKKYAYGAAALVGIPLGDTLSQTSAYLRLGIENGAYTFAVQPTLAPGLTYTGDRKNKDILSFAPGIGLKTFLRENLFLRAEYTYVHTRSTTITTADNSVGNFNLITHRFCPTEQRFMISLAYQF